MNSSAPPTVLDLVLVGGGHSHVHILKMCGMNRAAWAGVQITIISTHYHSPYSGMLPGYLAGHYSRDEIHLDICRLARFCGARFIQASACAISYRGSSNKTLNDYDVGDGSSSGLGMIYTSDGRPPIRYDCLSIDIGSSPSLWDSTQTDTSGLTQSVQRSISLNKQSTNEQNQDYPNASLVIPVKPISNFCQEYDAVVDDYCSRGMVDSNDKSPYTIAVVGGGAGGVELALSLQYHLQTKRRTFFLKAQIHPRPLNVILVTRSDKIMETHNRFVRRKFCRILQNRDLEVYYQAEVDRVEPVSPSEDDPVQSRSQQKKRLVFAQQASPTMSPPELLVDACFWCVSASAASWLRHETPFEVTFPGNFLRVKDTYELNQHPGVFATGDCCHMDAHPRPKAGVFAVRAGPILYENLYRFCCTGQPLRRHRPQKSFLGLISTGDKYAVASKGNWFCLEGAWLWKVKDWIDRKWMAKYSTELPDLTKMMTASTLKKGNFLQGFYNLFFGSNQLLINRTGLVNRKGPEVFEAFASDPMRCGGCGAKVDSTTVARVLRAVHRRQVARAAKLGYDPPEAIDHDDAAITMIPSLTGVANESSSRGAIIQTIDYFRELVNDPFTFGRIVAVHALSDVHAMGAIASTALALTVAPFAADEAITESVLLHLVCGVSDVLQDEGVRLVGGHTCEGHELACGLSIQGFTDNPSTLFRKSGGKIGDKIILTKPLGTGALFAAEMRGKSKGYHVQEALECMLQSSYKVSAVARNFNGVHACTDVTGFGLIGHLLEMLAANDVTGTDLERIGASLDIRKIQFYNGGREASANAIFSSLQFQNARNRRAICNHEEATRLFPVEYPLLFDPQTAGGLMFFVDPSKCAEFLDVLKAEHTNASIIGQVEKYTPGPSHHTTAPVNRDAAEPMVCAIGSCESATGLRIRIECR